MEGKLGENGERKKGRCKGRRNAVERHCHTKKKKGQSEAEDIHFRRKNQKVNEENK